VLDAPVVLVTKALFPAAKFCVPVAEELKFVVEPIEMFVETFPPPLLKNTPLIEPVTPKDPEIFTVFAAKSPFISGVPEPEAIYNLLLSSVVVEGPAPNPIAILFEELPENKHPAFCPNAILLDPTDDETKAYWPIAVLWSPVVLVHKALNPIAVLLFPVVFDFKALFPSAVLLFPVVLRVKAKSPIAVLVFPIVLLPKADAPIAVLESPVVLLNKANLPIAVL
jgi:hypothetical protein